MARKIKKGKKGVAAQYITRNMAIKRLQVSLAEFRRLCILKGIYPRDPKKKKLGKDKVYYHVKDILHLSYEPLLSKFREFKAYIKKYNKAIAKHEFSTAKKIIANKPTYTLHHVVKERYPSLIDALSNLDDALCSIALFASLPVALEKSISSATVEECMKTLNEFYHYVSVNGFLKKVFVSIKGYYFQAEIFGVKVLWLAPHHFTQELPADVDFRVLSTFLDFYKTLLKFVNFKLYAMGGLSLPKISQKFLGATRYGFLAFENPLLQFKTKEEDKSPPLQKETPKASTASEIMQKERDEEPTSVKSLFSGLVFFVSREVPLQPLAFIILNCGGKVAWEIEGCLLEESDQSITHQLVDRPKEHFKKQFYPSREYIQPQWVFDCLNSGILLPLDEYAMGRTLPPHLSPFVNDEQEGYIPEQRKKLNAIIEAKNSAKTSALLGTDTKDENTEANNEMLEALHRQEYQEEVEDLTSKPDSTGNKRKEISLNSSMNGGEKLPKANNLSEKEKEKELRKAMLSKKHKRLLDRIEFTKSKKSENARKLMEKRKVIEKKAKRVSLKHH